jgi:hypothetical protein
MADTMRSLLGCLLLAALSAFAAPANEQSQTSGEAWLSLIDRQNYSESWTQSASLFRSRVSQQRWTEMAKQVREPLGSVISRKVLSTTTTRTLPRAPEADYVVFRFQTSFRAKPEAIETLTVVLEDGQWKAVGYYIK